MEGRNREDTEGRGAEFPRLERLAPWAFFALKALVSAYCLYVYIPRYLRLTYIADGPARGIFAYALAYHRFELFQPHQFPPLHLWLWAALLKVYPDIYWTGTILNVAAGCGTALFLYLIGRQLAGPVAGAVAAVLFIFSPVHHNLTLSDGMVESAFFFWTAAAFFMAARAASGRRGAAAAGLFLAAAALSRYEGSLLLILYSGYRLFRARPRGAWGWLLWAAPLALVAVFAGHKAILGFDAGFWPALAGVKADTGAVLSNPHWYRRTYYGLERLWLDGRLAAALGVVGAVLVWRRNLRNEGRILIWAGTAALFVGLSAVMVIVGVGFSPERYFAVVLMLLFPFAGLAVVELWRLARGRPAKVALAAALAAVAAYTAYFDSAIKDYGYGYPGPCDTCLTLDAEIALQLRDLWRRGELAPTEIIYMEENTDNFSIYPIQAYSDHPLNFFITHSWAAERDLWHLDYILKRNDIRIAIFVNSKTRRQLKPFYKSYKKFAVIYEKPYHTIVVRRVGWRNGVPDFTSAVAPDGDRVIR